jgi:hypothetical protein
LAELGADIGAVMDGGETPLQVSIRFGQHQVARVLRELERTARARKEAAEQAARTAAGRGTVEATAAASQADACAACGSSSSSSGDPLKTCGRCKAVKYCSALCQRTHWPVHKASCAEATTGRGGADPAQGSGCSSTRAAESVEPSASTQAAATSESTQQAAAASAAGSSEQSSSGLHTTQAPLASEATSGTQQPDSQPAAGISKKDKERLRKERQLQRKTEEAREALDAALDQMVKEGEACAQPRSWRSRESALDVAEQATRTAERYQAHSETLAALVASAKQARRRLSRRERRRRSE